MTSFLVSTVLVERLGWVLVHSLWQFAVVAIIALLVERALQRTSPAVLYGFLLLAFATMAALPVATWFVLPADAPQALSAVGESEIAVGTLPPASIAARKSVAPAEIPTVSVPRSVEGPVQRGAPQP